MALYQYRVWCLTDNKWEYEWRESTEPSPTVCPVNPAHSIDLDSEKRLTTIVERRETNYFAEIYDVKDKDLASPPGSPTDEDRYIVANSATGSWLGAGTKLTQYNAGDTVWNFITPRTGKIVYVEDESEYYRFNGSEWEVFRAQGGSGNIISSHFEEIAAETEKSGSAWSQLLTLTATPSSASSKFVVKFDASLGISTNSDRQVDFRLIAGTGSGTERRGTYASSDKTEQVACAVLSCQFLADDASQHVFTIEWRIRSGNGTVSIDPQGSVYEHASLLVQEVR